MGPTARLSEVEPDPVTEVGVKVGVTPAGKPDTENVVVPVNEFAGKTEIVKDPLLFSRID